MSWYWIVAIAIPSFALYCVIGGVVWHWDPMDLGGNSDARGTWAALWPGLMAGCVLVLAAAPLVVLCVGAGKFSEASGRRVVNWWRGRKLPKAQARSRDV